MTDSTGVAAAAAGLRRVLRALLDGRRSRSGDTSERSGDPGRPNTE
jgi:hypothetical protein